MSEMPWLDTDGLLIRMAIGQCVMFVAMGWLILGGIRLRRQLRDSKPSAEALAEALRPAVEVFAGELRAEVAALRETAEAFERGASERAGSRRRNGHPKSDSTPSPQARDEARRLLAAGAAIDDVAKATGLPEGELAVLAGVLAQKA